MFFLLGNFLINYSILLLKKKYSFIFNLKTLEVEQIYDFLNLKIIKTSAFLKNYNLNNATQMSQTYYSQVNEQEIAKKLSFVSYALTFVSFSYSKNTNPTVFPSLYLFILYQNQR